MVGSSLSLRGKPKLKVVEGSMNSASYMNTLEHFLRPFARVFFKG